MIGRELITRVLAIRSVPPRVVAFTALASCGGLSLGILQNWPVWGVGLATALPWIPLFTSEVVWTYRHYPWLTLFYVLVITQGGHFLEHVAQMIQIHVLGLRGAAAQGVFGALNIEWVHFVWNTWVIVAVLVLLRRFAPNPWLRVTAILAGWHEIEHAFIMSVYLSTGKSGTPGLLARGGLVDGGLPLTRADLHFFYNLIETVPLVVAFVYQLKRSYDEWLKRAFPYLSEQVLTETTSKLWTLRFPAGETIVRQGEAPDKFYIISKGEVVVTGTGKSGQEVEISTLSCGQYFGEIGLLSETARTASIRAKTAVELLVLDRETFRELAKSSDITAGELAETVRRRLSRTVDVSFGEDA